MRTVLILGLLLGAVGCVERRLTVRSEPPGATVLVSGRELPRPTPVTMAFDHHGAFRVEVEKPRVEPEDVAYHRVVRTVQTAEPWYEMFPFDLFAEVLWPGTLTSETEVLVRLEPIPTEGPPEEELDRLLDEADEAREDLTGDE